MPPAVVTPGVLSDHGWQPVALEYSIEGAEVAQERGLNVIRADARYLPMGTTSVGLVVAFDILEHIEEDHLAAEEMFRMRAGGHGPDRGPGRHDPVVRP